MHFLCVSLFLEIEIFQIEVVEKIKTFMFDNFFPRIKLSTRYCGSSAEVKKE
jgi:hypothetical protein